MKRKEIRSRNQGYHLPQSNTQQHTAKPLFNAHIQGYRRDYDRELSGYQHDNREFSSKYT